MNRFLQLLWEQPARLVVLSFAGVIAVGTSLLMTPAASAGDETLGLLDALFTATSAVCVTGLIVVDTPVFFSFFGQLVILALIQTGAVGIIAFSMGALSLFRQRMSLGESELLSYMLNERNFSALTEKLRLVLVVTFGLELAGAAVLAVAMAEYAQNVGQAIWLGVFHSVSAFANAGFALFSDSLERFVGNPVVNFTVMALIVGGGIGFGTIAILNPVATERTHLASVTRRTVLRRYIRHIVFRLRGAWGVGARVALTGTIILLVGGTFLIYLLERGQTLSMPSLPQRYLAALFQSVTLRTAGFNTIPMGALGRTTLLVMIPFMFIGGASGGTAGGIKVGTAAILVAEVRRTVTGARDTMVFGRRIDPRIVGQAVVVTIIGVVVAGIAVVILAMSEAHVALEELLFEAFSAIGTVGLSTGITSSLSAVGRIVIIVLMFIGRLGPLTLLSVFRPRIQKQRLQYPEAELPVG